MIPALDFKSSNNACASMRILAEHVRREDGQVIFAETRDGVTSLKIQWPREKKR